MAELAGRRGKPVAAPENFKPGDKRLGLPPTQGCTSLSKRQAQRRGTQTSPNPILCSRQQLLLLSPRTRARASLAPRPGLEGPRGSKTHSPEGKVGSSPPLLQRKRRLPTRGSPLTTSQNSLVLPSRSGSALGCTDLRLHFPECPRETTATVPPPEEEVLPSTLSF